MPGKGDADSLASTAHDDPTEDLLDKFSPLRVAKIFPTNYKRKPVLLENYRPKEGKCLDYHLSETNVRWNVGDTKIRAKQIIADYVLAPPGYVSKKKPVFGMGGPPCWKWLDEIWREKMDRRNERYKEMFAEYVKHRRVSTIRAMTAMHQFLYELAGPPWYQELSVRQMAVIDNLQWCIDKDIRLNCIEFTKNNLAQLGLMLRANSKCIQKALRYCCGNDVEFLLVLYQISHSKRDDYSINDRLLLSAVYHLCIIETLRELHVRIPSPPRKEKHKIIPEKPTLPKKKKYPSPYLEPYTFRRDPPKHTGIYTKNLIQYPESPYFCYVDDLHEEISIAIDPRDIDLGQVEDPAMVELIEDMQKAQSMYNKLPHKIFKNLVPPTIKDRCKDMEGLFNKPGGGKGTPSEIEVTDKIVLPPLAELTSDHEEPCTCDRPDPDEIDPICCPQNIPCECPEDECDCKRLARLHIMSICRRCDIQKRYKQRIVIGGGKCIDGTLVPIIGGFYKERECLCMKRYRFRWDILDRAEKMGKEDVKFNIAGICYTPVGAFFIIQCAITPLGYKIPKIGAEKVCGRAICTCAEIEDFIPKDLVEVPIPEMAPSPIMPWEMAHCRCRAQLKKFLELQCHCEECEEQRRLENRDLILGGIKPLFCPESTNTEGYEVSVPIIQGVQDLHCDCLERYKEHLIKLEEYKQRVKARIVMKTREHKYAIGGVVQTKDGPVYQIQGLRTPLKCICAEVDAEMRAEEEERKRMPKMPPTGRTKFAIAGVYAGGAAAAAGAREEGENLFILTQALGKPCKCHRLYEAFEEEHKNCTDYFEEYMKKTMDDILAVEMEEAQKRQKEREKAEKLKALEPSPPTPPLGYCPNPCDACDPCQCIEEPDDFDNRTSFARHSSTSSGTASNIFSIGSNKCDCALEAKEVERENNLIECEPCNKDFGVQAQPPGAKGESESGKEETGKRKPSTVNEGSSSPATSASQPPKKKEEPEDSEVYDLKRFVILEKIPCNEEDMKETLMKVLATMAEDGFPLAKLPECHRLPIFRLWTYLRCRKCWTLKERLPFKAISVDYNVHNISCYYNIPYPEIPISKTAASKLTWKHAKYVKEMITTLTEDYYRKVKQSRIDGMREYFPALFNYEFPEMRKTIFAYLPSKEEDLIIKSSHYKY